MFLCSKLSIIDRFCKRKGSFAAKSLYTCLSMSCDARPRRYRPMYFDLSAKSLSRVLRGVLYNGRQDRDLPLKSAGKRLWIRCGDRPYGWIGPGFRACRQIHLGIDKKKALPFEGRAFLCLLVKLLGLARFARANACAGAAVDALVRIDYINITGRDCLYRTFVDTCAASYAQIGTNFVSHFFVLLKLCVDGANIKIYLIIKNKIWYI